ncbi:MAG: hypothetical protein EP298_04225 [Gammaproteobacteria bacterium]|nr:MAG: hypothetical protein EP298_04225 [Gammaproteobacteria bacterium]UTW43837.1 hypothetical protein KFE69_07035 [bacterium SCSIO 12844]
MCDGVIYQFRNKHIKTYFSKPKSTLLVLLDNGEIEQHTWGRRKGQSGFLPLGGWARKTSLDKGIWNQWFPKFVPLLINEFMEKDKNYNSHWFSVIKGKYIQGVLLRCESETRVYVVTIEPPEEAIHNRWPLIKNFETVC